MMLGGDDLTARERIKVTITLSVITLVLLAIMALIGWLVGGTAYQDVSGLAEPSGAAGEQAQQLSSDTAPMHVESSDPVVVMPPRSEQDAQTRAGGEDRSAATLAEENGRPKSRIDEEAAQNRDRERATQEMRDSYFLLFEDLGLTSQEEEEELFSFLAEVQIAGLWTSYQDGRTMDPGERATRIAAIIGYPKLREFLALEGNLASYWEVRRIESMLERKGAPITETKRDGLFEILVATRRDRRENVPSDVERRSVEHLEYILAELDDRERRVIELAPSVLSAQHVVHLHARYQDCSYQRLRSLEMQKRYRLEHPEKMLPIHYPGCSP